MDKQTGRTAPIGDRPVGPSPTPTGPSREEGMGPGLQPAPGLDPTVPTAAVLVAIGWIPVRLWEAVLGVAYFGPLAFPAIIAIAGVLVAVIGVLRSLDLKDAGLRRTCIVIGALGMLRLFVVPWI